MEPLVRKQISITRAQAQALRERARREHLSEAELLRRAVGALLEAPQPDPPDGATAELMRFIRETNEACPAEPRAPHEGRGWTRDELYDDRVPRSLR